MTSCSEAVRHCCLRLQSSPHKPINRSPQSPNRENRIWRQNLEQPSFLELQTRSIRPHVDKQPRWLVALANPNYSRSTEIQSLGKLCHSVCEGWRGNGRPTWETMKSCPGTGLTRVLAMYRFGTPRLRLPRRSRLAPAGRTSVCHSRTPARPPRRSTAGSSSAPRPSSRTSSRRRRPSP